MVGHIRKKVHCRCCLFKFMDFSQVIKNVNNDYIKLATDMREKLEFVDTGSLIFNALCSGDLFKGICKSTITAIAGDQGTGKTYFSLSVVKKFLDENVNGKVLYFESESALSKELLKSREIPLDRFYLIPVATVEEFRNTLSNMIDNYLKFDEKDRDPIFIVLDSLGMLSTNEETEKAIQVGVKEPMAMTRARLIKGVFRVITLKLGEYNIPMIVTNHTYDKPDIYAAKDMSGGSGIKFAASQIIYLSKSKEKEGTEIVGNIIKAKVIKSRLSRENKEVEIRLFFDKRGLDRYYGILELAIHAGLVTQGGAWYTFVKTGEKVQRKKIYENIDEYFNEEFMNELNEYVKKQFSYGN